MKKIFFTLPVLALCLCLQSSAQFMFGPQAGVNLATLSGTDVSVTSKPFWHGGIFVSIPLGKHFSVIPAVLYSMKGYKYNDSTVTTTNIPDSTVTVAENVNATLGYLDIPVLLTYFTDEMKGFMIQAGPQFSYLITDNSTVTTTATPTTNGTVQHSNPVNTNNVSFNKSDFALVGGIGYKWPQLLMVYARVATSFSKTQGGGWVASASTGHNFVFEVGAALCFGAK